MGQIERNRCQIRGKVSLEKMEPAIVVSRVQHKGEVSEARVLPGRYPLLQDQLRFPENFNFQSGRGQIHFIEFEADERNAPP